MPARAGVVLWTLITVAAVANLNLSVANVALTSIGRAFDASQASLNLIAVGFSLGLAASVLYLGAVGDHYGRKLLLLLGTALSIPTAILAAMAWSEWVLILARIFGGVAAGMAFPTTLALITALWADGPGRTAAIAKWSAIGSGLMVLGPLAAGWLLEHFWWGSVFLVTVPLSVVAFGLAWRFVPAHVNETPDPVDHPGGVLSMVMIAALVLGINFAPIPQGLGLALALGVVAVVAAILFVLRQRRADNPLFDLDVAKRRLFWVAAVSGIIVFGTLMGTMYIGQQFMQNVLGYDTLLAGTSVIPMALAMVAVAGLSARMVDNVGSRTTLLVGYGCFLAGFAVMLVLWGVQTSYWAVGLAYVLVGLGVGFCGTPASHSLTASVPVSRAGMASATSDLQRDLGGAVMQSVLGVLLTVGYAASMASAIAQAPDPSAISDTTVTQLQKSYSGAEEISVQYPQYAEAITSAAKQAFLQGANWAYAAGIVAILLAAAVTWWRYPGRDGERELVAEYQKTDAAEAPLPSR
ncbi:MAG: MFS transporter [Candidatus Nanopelagicales bacterium]|jgi:MFS family permease|nr:MFS transporter [Candidatus Nanopelagicales bacterium]